MRANFFTNPWASGDIRGTQIAEFVGGSINPDKIYADDVNFFVKSVPAPELLSGMKNIFIDVVDSYGVIPWIRRHPEVGVIAMSGVAKKYLDEQLKRTDVILIPEHHCNFEGVVHKVDIPTVAGFIGYKENLQIHPDEIAKALEPLGIKFMYCCDFKNRFDVTDFYRRIDIQITFRATTGMKYAIPELKNPLKLANAGSFGIPTIAFPEPSYVDEWGDQFCQVGSLDEIVLYCDKMINEDSFYKNASEKALHMSEQYHIDIIAKLYKEVIDGCKSDI